MTRGVYEILTIIILSLTISGCNSQQYADDSSQLEYQEMKGKFDALMTDHFPVKKSQISSVYMSLNTKKDELGLILYQYEIPSDTIRKIRKEIEDKAIAYYTPSDDCLFIINRFETFQTLENREVITNVDSAKVNDSCYKDLYPIPNFIRVENPMKHSDIKLNETYRIYVLEAKPGVFYKELQPSPSPQMPKNWGNGYSKGIAISEKDNTVIYWGIIW